MASRAVLSWIDDHAAPLTELSREVWRLAEPSLAEYQSAAALAEFLERRGFSVERGVAGLPTAFVADYDSGRSGPVIGFLGEYDALPELSQAVEAVRRPVKDSGYGHGCGHNLLGVGAMAAALALKAAMEAGLIDGRVIFYGCPAEETLTGKVFMARERIFDAADVAITWHPGAFNTVTTSRHSAMNSFKVNFYGVSAHAAGSPEMGRSALDGVELMSVGVNYLREHITSHARIHSVVTSGGIQPNVVPSYSQVWYYVRTPRRDQLEEVYSRVLDQAKGAALMAGVDYDVEFLGGCYDTLLNEPLIDAAQKCMERIGGPVFSDEEKSFAAALSSTHPPGQRENAIERAGIDLPHGVHLHEGVLPDRGRRGIAYGSTDVGDVSWCVPTVSIETACWPIGNAGHSWQNTASSGSTIGLKGMLHAAKAMALIGVECSVDQNLVRRAKEEFDRQTASGGYRCPLPADMAPPLPKSV